MEQLYFAGDVGGTKINLALFHRDAGRLAIVREQIVATREAPDFESVAKRFIGDAKVASGAIGVAGPVRDGIADATNIPWQVGAKKLAAALRIERIAVINDLVAMGWGVSALPAESFHALNPGEYDEQGNAALIAAGTGLGESILIKEGETWRPIPSEGGHASFAPQDDTQDALLNWLRPQFGGHVSAERVLSGPGLFNIHRFLRDTGRGEEFDWMRSRFEAADPAAVVAELAMEGRAPICESALEIFCAVYGAEAGNLALKSLATGGVFLGGGIAPKILPFLERGHFMRGFTNKGRLAELMRKMPVKVVLEPNAPLYGAAFLAERMGT